jgi:CBS domain-containing protein
MTSSHKQRRIISELTLEELFGTTLTDTSCVYIDKERVVWVAAEMCAQYLESAVDSILVLDDTRPVGIVGGYDLLDHLRKNPSRDSQYLTRVGEIMFKDLPQIGGQTRLGQLLENWKASRRAFAYVASGSDYSPVSARKMLEIGMRVKTDISISSMPKTKGIVTFHRYDTLGSILDLMFEHKTRKLVLEGSNQFISDRLILGEVSKILKFQENLEYLLDLPIKQLPLGYSREIDEDMNLGRLCSLMDKMDHPYIIYKKGDMVVTPWDVCLALQSEALTESQLAQAGYLQPREICPHCGKGIG